MLWVSINLKEELRRVTSATNIEFLHFLHWHWSAGHQLGFQVSTFILDFAQHQMSEILLNHNELKTHKMIYQTLLQTRK